MIYSGREDISTANLLIGVFISFLLLLAFDLGVLISLNRKLQLALEDAERANKSKSDFLSNMSHEIRTPITAILGMNELIQREGVNPAVLEYSGNIQKAGVSLLGIISDILDFSRIEAGHLEIMNSEYNTADLIGDMYNLIYLRSQVKGLEFTVKADPMLPKKLIGDELRVKQVLTNLLTNAVKYTETGRIELMLRVDSFDENSIDLYAEVSDTGIGIREEEMNKLFSAFDRLDEQKTRTIEGSGLGLAITQKMLNMMGTSLEVESRYGVGSRFFFNLRQQVSDWDRIGEFNPLSYSRGLSADRRSKASFIAPSASILIVDDTPMNLQVIVGLLKRYEMRVDVASSGRECIDRFGDNEYDLVFLDYRMPVMDGIETLKELYERFPEKAAATPIISLTASAVAGDRERMLEAGFDDYLSKPVNGVRIENIINRFIKPEKIIALGEQGEQPAEDSAAEQTKTGDLPPELLNTDLIDPAAGLDYCGDRDAYMAALRMYSESAPKKADQMKQDFDRGDHDKMTLTAHSLKSTSRAIGAGEISRLAREIELAGKEGDTTLLDSRINELIREIGKLSTFIKNSI